MYRFKDGELQVFLAHPGGPYFKKKDEGHWTIPKGEIHAGENLLDTAIREFQEETGIQATGEFIELGSIRQKGGKLVHGWAFRGNWDESIPITSNTCKLEWPPLSGKFLSFGWLACSRNVTRPGYEPSPIVSPKNQSQKRRPARDRPTRRTSYGRDARDRHRDLRRS